MAQDTGSLQLKKQYLPWKSGSPVFLTPVLAARATVSFQPVSQQIRNKI
jgi:hypothetical protein